IKRRSRRKHIRRFRKIIVSFGKIKSKRIENLKKVFDSFFVFDGCLKLAVSSGNSKYESVSSRELFSIVGQNRRFFDFTFQIGQFLRSKSCFCLKEDKYFVYLSVYA